MNLSELKSMVRSHLTELEIKAFGYDLRRRESWEALADRCKEYAAAKLEQATDKIIETVKETVTYDNCTAAAFTATSALTRLAKQSIELLVMTGVFCWFLFQELRQSGIIDRTLARMAELDSDSTQLAYWDLTPEERQIASIVSYRSPMLASSWPIAA